MKPIEVEFAESNVVTDLTLKLLHVVRDEGREVGTLDPDAICNALLVAVTVMVSSHPEAKERDRMVATVRHFCDTQIPCNEHRVKRWRKRLDLVNPALLIRPAEGHS